MNKFTLMVVAGLVLSLMAPISVFAKDDQEHKHHKNDKDLPPGLQKKVNRGQPLPPGWQKYSIVVMCLSMIFMTAAVSLCP